jgi:hypothetical protein
VFNVQVTLTVACLVSVGLVFNVHSSGGTDCGLSCFSELA